MKRIGYHLSLLTAALLWAAPGWCAGALDVQVMAGHNLVVDSNATSPATYSPKAAYISATVCNTGDAPLDNVFLNVGDYDATPTPGIFPRVNSDDGFRPAGWVSPTLNNTGEYFFTLESGSAGIGDGGRYIGTLNVDECRVEYWLISYPQCVNVDGEQQYPPCDEKITGGIGPEDDLTLEYDVWATTTTGGVTSPVAVTRDLTMRSEISASANKIWPNTTAKVPDEYLAAIQSVVGWGTVGPDGQPLTSYSTIYPGQRVITTQGIWYDLGNVGGGFDNDGDLIPDQNAWLQPVGDPGSFDAGCFKLVNIYGVVIVKLKTGGDLLIPFRNELYFQNLPDNTGVVGLVYYQYIATREGCSGNLTPYQESASGFDNEKFCGDYGLSLGLASGTFGSKLGFSKTDGLDSIAPGGTLTYTVGADNGDLTAGTGAHLGAPDLGMPMVFRETIAAGTTFVAGSADDSPADNLVEPSGTGTYSQGFTSVFGDLTTCPIDYQVTASFFTVLYSTDGGMNWTVSEPAASSVTDIKWVLSTTMALDGGFDGNGCIDRDGTFTDGTFNTSLPAGTSATVHFQTTVDATTGPIVCNVAGLAFGPADPGIEAEDCTLVTGSNTLSGTVFRDEGTGGGTYGNGVQDGGEGGVGNGVLVSLYYDFDGDGELGEADVLYGTTTTPGAGTYSFTSLPDGPYLVVVKKYDGATSNGVNDAVNDFATGYGNTTRDPALPLTTNQGILVMSEDVTVVTLAVNVDLGHTTGVAQTVPGVNFGFAPPLELTKSPPAASVDEGDVFNFVITLQNRLPSVGRQGPTGCEYTVWANTGVNGPASGNKNFTDPTYAWDGPNGTVASAYVEGGGNRYIDGRSFALADQAGAVTRVEALFHGYYGQSLDDDSLAVEVTTADGTETGTITTAMLDSYIGPPADLDPNSAISWDMTALRPGGGSWSWNDDFSQVILYVNPQKSTVADNKYFYLDGIGLRITTDAACQADQSTTLDPVPLQDSYDTASFTYVSADPPPTSVNTATGVISWDNVGPIPSGGTATVAVTLKAVNVSATQAGSCNAASPPASGTGCNWAETAYGTKNVYYADGRPANDDLDNAYVTINAKAEIRGVVFSDTNNDRWPIDAGEPGLPNVTVTLWACTQKDGFTLETAVVNKTCLNATGGNFWDSLATTQTDANGAYEFLGLDTGTYVVEVGDSDGAVASGTGGNLSPYGKTQTTEPDDDQSVTGGNADAPTQGTATYNNTWGDIGRTIQNLNPLSGTEIINGVNFGYYSASAVLYGMTWWDVDGDATRDPGEIGTGGFAIFLYSDPNGDGDPADGSLQATTSSNDAGGYFFSGLGEGSYVVVSAPPTLLRNAWAETVESTGGTGSLDNQMPVSIIAGQVSGSHDFGYTLADTSAIGDSVYFDFDADGSQDPGEAGIPNVTVWLYEDRDNDGTIDEGVDGLLATDVTDADGRYLFEDYPYGSYVVKVDTSDPDFPSGAVATGDRDTNTAVIGNFVWLDADGDGVQDSGEEGLPGVVLVLYEDADGNGSLDTGTDRQVSATMTDVTGGYLFTGLAAGTYFVDVDETTLPSAALALTTPDPGATAVVLASNSSSVLTVDAGYSPSGTYALGNRVWHDVDNGGDQDAGEVGLENIRVWIDSDNDGVIDWTDVNGNGLWESGEGEQWARTDCAGYYLLTGLSNGSYAVKVYDADLPRNFIPRTGGSSSQTATVINADLANVDFGYRFNPAEGASPTGSITGRVFLDGDGDGAYDAGEALDGTTVNLLDGHGNIVATTVTAADGAYSFAGAFIGDYSVQAVDELGTRRSVLFLAAGQAFANLNVIYNAVSESTADSMASVTIDGVHDNLLQDFGYRRFQGSIGDTVFQDVNESGGLDIGEPGIGGVTVGLYSAFWYDADGDGMFVAAEAVGATLVSTAVTTVDDPLTAEDESGRYLFSNLDTPRPALVFTGGTTLGSATVTSGSRFTAADVGRPIAGEGIPAGATITAFTDASTVTISVAATATGSPSITLSAQYYLVRVDTTTFPSGSTLALVADPDTDGVPCSLLPDPDDPDDEFPPPAVCDDRQLVRGFTSTTNYLGADFGYLLTGTGFATIGDHLWIDADGDGTLDSGEAGIPRVTVWMDDDNNGLLDWTDDNGNGAWDSGEGERWVETDSDGYYVFATVADGTYRLRVRTADPDWPVGLPTTPVYEARSGNNDSLNNLITVTVAGGAVSVLDDGDGDTGDGCTGCNLDADFGYRYSGTNTLQGTICIESGTLNGYCGATDTTYSDVTTGESPLAGIQVTLYRWTDDGDNIAWSALTGALDSGDTFNLLGSTTTNALGDYSFSYVPDNVIVVFGVNSAQNARLTTTNGTTSVEDAGVVSRQLYEFTGTYDALTVTTGVRQALNLAGDADNLVRDLDYALDGTVGGLLLYDFGDLPDSGDADYNATLLANSGAQHLMGTVYLGLGITDETDGYDSQFATGDDDDGVFLLDGGVVDEDGGRLQITVSGGTGWLAGWIDFNNDGDFADVGERIINQAVDEGISVIGFYQGSAPLGTADYFARFRLYPSQPLMVASSGIALDGSFNRAAGEVEDYLLTLKVTRVSVSSFSAYEEAGMVTVAWETSSEHNTVGFFLRRREAGTDNFEEVNDRILPSLVQVPQGGTYRYVDPGAVPGGIYDYELVEIEATGRRLAYGPFLVDTGARPPSAVKRRQSPGETGYSRVAHRRTATPNTVCVARGPRKGVVGTRAKLAVQESGIRYLSLDDLAAGTGVSRAELQASIASRSWGLTQGGSPVAYLPTRDLGGVYFYGQELDSPYALDNIYWAEQGVRGTRMKVRRSAAAAGARGDETFARTARAEVDLMASPGLFTDASLDYWMWDYLFGGDAPKSFALRVDTPAADGGDAILTLRLKGGSETEADPDHHATIAVNGTPVGEVRWNGLDEISPSFVLHPGLLRDGGNEVTITALADTGADWSLFFLDSMEVSYRSRYRAVGDRLDFSSDGNRSILLEGFSGPDVMVFDVTDPRVPVFVVTTAVIAEDGTWSVPLRPGRRQARYHAMTREAAMPPDRIEPGSLPHLRDAGNRAGYLLVTTAGLLEEAGRLADYRGNLTSMVVDIEDIYDEFGHGIPGPEALRSFLAHARATWSLPPRMVVLVGDGTYDYRDIEGAGGNLVPPFMVGTPFGIFPSDNRFGDVAGDDGVPELAVGRLPVADAASLANLIDKIIRREAAEERAWTATTLMLADNPDRAGDFPAGSERIALQATDGDLLERIYLSEERVETARPRVIDGIRAGAGIVNYIGHAGFDTLADEGLLRNEDLDELDNIDRPTILTALTCIANHFAVPGYPAFGPRLVSQTGGGAAAVWAPSGMSQDEHAVVLGEEFYRRYFGAPGVETIGEAVLGAFQAYGRQGRPSYMIDIYALLGDPAMLLH